ncbi:MAG TPA: hypothetical protein VFQ70_00025, partial [Candidatus Saccharimonadaceae bacterium]|nr:hypothetical protein [Candidatus Saccharimonadaceae bacterium]
RTKLLVVLASGIAAERSKTAALSVATPALTTPIAELEKKATEKHPKERVSPPEKPTAQVSKASASTANQNDFSWDALVAEAQKNFVALYSVLNKCSGSLKQHDLTIYARNSFYKKKLDDPKYRPKLAECLDVLGYSNIEITTIPTVKPPKDSQTAAVAAIMGGGEEVEL